MQRGNMQFLQALFSHILISVTVLLDMWSCILETENGSAMHADDLTRKGDARYVRFAVSGAPAYWCLDRAIEAQ